MMIRTRIEQAVSEAVARHLETELAERGLLIGADGLAALEAEAAEQGAQLLTAVMQRCYPVDCVGRVFELTYESDQVEARIAAALAFGAQAARVLAPRMLQRQPAESIDVLCAMFNLGIGLVDSLCDEDAETGVAFLDVVHGEDVLGAAEELRGRGWLRAALPSALPRDHAVSFTVDITETFFETLHSVYPGDAWVHYRCGLGAQLAVALEAERASVARSANPNTPEQLLACSRLTSVIPFQIIEVLAGGTHAATEQTAGTLLGEAMWRIDDLVDLCQDARSGALNGVLLAAEEGPRHVTHGGDQSAVLERLLASTQIRCAAAKAAENLLAVVQPAARGSGQARDHQASRTFLYFVQRYAGISPSRGHDPATPFDSTTSINSSNSVSSIGRSVRGGM